MIRKALLVIAVASVTGCSAPAVESVLPDTPTTVERKPWFIHVPPQVEAGNEFSVYADYDVACGFDDALAATVDDTAKTLTLRLTVKRMIKVPCPGAVIPRRIDQRVTLREPGSYRLVAQASRPLVTTTIEVLPAGQPAPEWTPPPFEGLY
jgi:hypothetical protein